MRKLKKALSLVLALAMVLSLCVVGFADTAESAADYSDYSLETATSEEYYAAVDILTQLGYVEGTDATTPTLDSEEGFTRAQAAKIITYILAGYDAGSAVAGLSDTVTEFTDVDTDTWYNNYVAYAVAADVIVGYGDGTYGPTDELTTNQWLKILICALYDVDETNFEGTSWEVNTLAFAINAGLISNDEVEAYGDELDREFACALAVRAMLAAGDGSTTNVATVIVNGVTITYAVKDSDVGGLTVSENRSIFGQIISYTYTRLGGDESATVDVTGNNDTYDYDYDVALVADYSNTTTKVSDLTKAVNSKGSYTYYIDGEVQTTAPTSVGALGTYVLVYQTGAAAYDVIIVNTYYYVVTGSGTIAIENGYSLSTKDYSVGDVLVYFAGYVQGTGAAAVVPADESNLTAAAGITLTVAEGIGYNVAAVSAAYAVSSTATTGYVVLGTDADGDKTYISAEYQYTSNDGQASEKMAVSAKDSDKYAVYYDTFGNIIYDAEYVDELISDVGYIYITSATVIIDETESYNVDDLDEVLYDAVIYMQVDGIVVSSDLSSAWVEESINIQVVQGSDGSYHLYDEYGYLESDSWLTNDLVTAVLNASHYTYTRDNTGWTRYTNTNIDTFYSYYESDETGFVIADKVEEGSISITSSSVSYGTKSSPMASDVTVAYLTATASSTKITDVEIDTVYSKSDVYAATGTNSVVVIEDGGTSAEQVIILSWTSVADDYVMYKSVTEYANGTAAISVVYSDGTTGTLTLSKELYESVKSGLTAGTVYVVDYDDEGTVVGIKAFTEYVEEDSYDIDSGYAFVAECVDDSVALVAEIAELIYDEDAGTYYTNGKDQQYVYYDWDGAYISSSKYEAVTSVSSTDYLWVYIVDGEVVYVTVGDGEKETHSVVGSELDETEKGLVGTFVDENTYTFTYYDRPYDINHDIDLTYTSVDKAVTTYTLAGESYNTSGVDSYIVDGVLYSTVKGVGTEAVENGVLAKTKSSKYDSGYSVVTASEVEITGYYVVEYESDYGSSRTAGSNDTYYVVYAYVTFIVDNVEYEGVARVSGGDTLYGTVASVTYDTDGETITNLTVTVDGSSYYYGSGSGVTLLYSNDGSIDEIDENDEVLIVLNGSNAIRYVYLCVDVANDSAM